MSTHAYNKNSCKTLKETGHVQSTCGYPSPQHVVSNMLVFLTYLSTSNNLTCQVTRKKYNIIMMNTVDVKVIEGIRKKKFKQVTDRSYITVKI